MIQFNFRNKRKPKEREKFIIDDGCDFSTKEAYNSVRTNIMFSLPNDGACKILIMSSPAPSDGKTTTSINTAITLASAGSKVLLVDADMRKPMIHNYLDLPNEKGLSGILNGFNSVKETVAHSDKYQFDFISSGVVPPNPSELIMSENTEAMFNELKEHYDYILVDTPPIGIVSDAVTLSKFSDGVILVLRHNYTTHEMIDKCVSILEFAQTKLLGFILNDTNYENFYYKKGYSRKYGYYRYGYGYGYDRNHASDIEKDKKTKARNK